MTGFDNTQQTSVNQPQEGNQQLSQQVYSGSLPWRAAYGQVAPLAQQAVLGQQNYNAEYSNNVGQAPIIYSPGTYYGQQQTGGYDTGTHGVPPSSVGQIQQPGYSNPQYNPQTSAFNPGENTGNTGDPNIYPQGYAFQGQQQPGTETQQPGAQGYQGYQGPFGQGQQGQPQQRFGQNGPQGTEGNTMGYSPNANGSNGSDQNAFATPGSSSSEALQPPVSVLGSFVAGGAGAVAGKYFIPKAGNALADKILGTSTENGPSLFADAGKAESKGLFAKLWGKDAKLIPDDWKAKFGSKVNEATDEVTSRAGRLGQVGDFAKRGANYDAVAWQNNFAPQYATRTGLQDILDSNNSALQGLIDKSGLSETKAQTLAKLNGASRLAEAGGPALSAAKASQLEELTTKSGLSAEEVNKLTDTNWTRNAMGTPGALDEINPKFFSTADGPAMVAKAQGLPLSEEQMATVNKQGDYFDSLAKTGETTTTAAKDEALLAKPGVGDFIKGGLLIGGATLGSNMVDSFAGGPNALHLSNYGLMGAFVAGDTLQQKAVYMGGTLAANFVLDKLLPASSHTTISNIMRPTGWDSVLQGAAMFLPAANTQSRLLALGAAWGTGRLANMDFMPSLATTGVVGAATGFLLRSDPELAAGAITLEAGAWGVSRIMHAL
ncbi:MAG TPA: hypothetical protein V6C72_18875 [Chroococcales cyanobacterium]